jgi:hypothetical protein
MPARPTGCNRQTLLSRPATGVSLRCEFAEDGCDADRADALEQQGALAVAVGETPVRTCDPEVPRSRRDLRSVAERESSFANSTALTQPDRTKLGRLEGGVRAAVDVLAFVPDQK